MNYYTSIDQEAIETGQRQQRGKCAVAYSLANRYPELRHINVDREEIRFTDVHDRRRYCFQTPEEISQFIDAWDRGESPEPTKLALPKKRLKWTRPQRSRSVTDLIRPVQVNTDLKVDRKVSKPPSARSISKRPLISDAA